MSETVKPSTVTLPPESVTQLRELSATRKAAKNLAWSQQNITIELINNAHKKECK
jgi:hypothetical protein